MFNKDVNIHIHFHLGEKTMKTVQELLELIATIAAAGSIADVKTEVESLKTTAAALTQKIADNDADDTATKQAVTDLQTLTEALVDQLAGSQPGEPAPTTGEETSS